MEIVNEEWPCWPDEVDLRTRDDGTEESGRVVAYLDVELAEQRALWLAHARSPLPAGVVRRGTTGLLHPQ